MLWKFYIALSQFLIFHFFYLCVTLYYIRNILIFTISSICIPIINTISPIRTCRVDITSFIFYYRQCFSCGTENSIRWKAPRKRYGNTGETWCCPEILSMCARNFGATGILQTCVVTTVWEQLIAERVYERVHALN